MSCLFMALCLAACNHQVDHPPETWVGTDSLAIPADSFPEIIPDSLSYDQPATGQINTGVTKPEELVAFAKTLKGVPYSYGSCDRASGFDCSGFVHYVFDQFKITVPRSSSGFSNVGKAIDPNEARPGDLILFTGTDSSIRTVGHMGIVITDRSDDLQFIHSSSGSAHGVTTSPLKGYYQGRFMKVIRVFKHNDGA